MDPAEKPKTYMKVVCVGEEERVVGLHIHGMAVDEILQGFGVAMRMGATKRDLDRCMAIHPTGEHGGRGLRDNLVPIQFTHYYHPGCVVVAAAEELVTLAPWYGSKRHQ